MYCAKFISKSEFLIQKKKIFIFNIRYLYWYFDYLIQKMTLKEIFDRKFDWKSKRSKSFYKKQVNKSVNSMIKEEFSDSKDRRIQIWTVSRRVQIWIIFRRISFSTVELKFNCSKFQFSIALILSFIIKEFACI